MLFDCASCDYFSRTISELLYSGMCASVMPSPGLELVLKVLKQWIAHWKSGPCCNHPNYIHMLRCLSDHLRVVWSYFVYFAIGNCLGYIKLTPDQPNPTHSRMVGQASNNDRKHIIGSGQVLLNRKRYVWYRESVLLPTMPNSKYNQFSYTRLIVFLHF